MGYLDYAGLQYLWGKLKEKFAPKSHSHDDRYYTEAEMDGKLNSKVNNNEAGADSLLSKLTTSWTATPTDNTYFIRQDTGGGDSFGRVKFSTLWNYIKGKTDGVYQPKGNYSTTDTKNTAGSTNTTSKLYLIGSTSQSTNPQTYSNASVYTTGSTIYANGFGNDIFIIYPSGGSASYGGQQIGYCKITLPTLWDSTMMTFTVTIYNYVSNTSVDYRISGYNYSGKPWYNCAAVCVGKAGTSHSNLSVRFGDNGTKNVITIGEEDTEWEYPRIVVHDVVIGNSNFETYKSGWNVEISKSGAPNVSETISNTHVGYNAVTSWDKIQNKPSSFTPASHDHDDRYYTESEINTKLDGKSNANHTHNSIKDAGDGGTLTLAYSKSGLDYGSYSWLAGWNGKELRAVNKNQFATAYHTHDTSSISAGNANYAGYAGPIESAHIDVLRANRLAFLPASGIKVEYSVDGGATWIDYGANDAQKASLFAMRMGSATPFYTGKHTKAAECTTKDQLRITVTPVDRYASVNMLYLWVSVAGTSATVNISRSTIGAKETFTDVRTDVPISGWSGPNEIRFSQGTFGGGSTQTSNQYAYRFTFKNKADGKGSVCVMDIRMYGPSAWGAPNSMMEKDHIYNWDANQNVQFPAQVTATKFNGSSTGVVDYGNAAGATIKIGFNGAGLTKDKLTHIAGYAKDGNQTVIKDVDRGVLQSWLNLNEMINTQLTASSSTPSDNDFYISQYAGGGATTTTYHRRPISALWNYIKSKADAVYSAKSHTHTKSQITDFPASLKNPTALTIQTNGTTVAIYDGSAAKTVNITKSNIGLGNVDNTADANKSVKYATSAGSASTATKATTADSATTSNGVKDYNDANRTIKIGFAGDGLNTSNLTHIAGYTDNGTKIKDVSKDVLKSWIGLGNYLPLIGGTMSGQITKSTGGSWIGDRDRAAIKSSYAGDSSYGAVAAMATKNGYWTMGNLGGDESLIFNYSTDAKYNAGKNETSQVYLPAQAGTIITSATIGSQSVNYANRAGNADVANSVDWSKVQNKPSSYAPASHTHDDRYYTESEVNIKLANYQPKGNYAAAEHTHNYAGSGNAGGSANSAVKLDSSAGSATQPVYFKDGKPVATTYALNKTVPADAKFTDTNTWRGIQNNLTSDSTDQSLSAAQGKALKTLVDGKAPTSHKHTKSQITDFPTSMPASDVSAWAKAATKPSYTKAEVGLGNVDNTADKDKNVKFATSAGSATNAQCLNNDSQYMRFHWNGQSGQPSWLWGGSDSGDMYVYNPSNFNVNYATTAGNGTVDFQTKVTTDGYFGAVRFGNGVQICWFTMKSARNRTFLLPFADINYAIAFSGGYCWLNVNNRTTTGFTVGVEWSGYENSYIAIGRWK